MGKLLLAFLFLSFGFAWAQTQYVVRKGDTLLKIADKSLGITNGSDPRRYDFVKKVRGLNPELKNPNELEPGQTIIIPNVSKTASDEKVRPVKKPVVVVTPPVTVDPSSVGSQSAGAADAAPSEMGSPTPTTVEAPIQSSVSKPELPPPTTAPVTEPSPAQHSASPTPQPADSTALTPPHVAATSSSTAKHGNEEHHNFFFVQPRYQTLKIDTKETATDTTASMTAQSSAGLDIQYGLILNHRFHLLFQAGVTQTQFKDIEGDNTPTVNHKSETLKSFAVGVALEATSTLHLDLMLMYADRTFLLPGATLPEYELHAISLPGAELNISWDIYSGSSNVFGISAIGEYIGEATKDLVEYKSTVEPIGALYWKSKYGHDRLNYKVTLMYKHGNQDTSLTKQNEDLGVLGVGFFF
ncbi:MAG: LysM peptidoglycan-binding domain-containing protein [Bdellovibrionaceae bacterium]|nr:LysM peptidoglycan-binding domain-containing protein [Pseudobdellovibrionaceae bacterium]